MRSEIYSLGMQGAAVGAGAGASQRAEEFTDHTFQLVGTFTGTVRVEGSLDGSTWFPLTSDMAAAGVMTLVANAQRAVVKYVRTFSAYTAGTNVAVLYGARNTRTA